MQELYSQEYRYWINVRIQSHNAALDLVNPLMTIFCETTPGKCREQRNLCIWLSSTWQRRVTLLVEMVYSRLYKRLDAHLFNITKSFHINMLKHRRGGVEVDRSPRMREIGVRFPVATDLSRKTGSDSSTAKRLATGVSVTGPRR